MIERIVGQKEPIRVILGNDRKTAHLVLSWRDTNILDSIVAVLHPLREFTDLLAGEKRVTASAVLPLLNHITKNVLVRKDGETDLTCEIKERIKLDLTFRYSHEDIIHFFEICTFLDPRFKQAHFSDENCQNLESRVKQEMFDLYNDHNVSTSSTLIQTEEPPAKKPKTAWGKIFGKSTVNTSTTLTPDDEINKEVKQYKYIPKPDIESSPLVWWKLHHGQFPLMQKLARKYLCCCATSVSSERVFSTGGRVVNGRISLKPEKVNELIFLTQNL